ncbi:metalloregulator ArsR/SmtB family transcription factor [Arthrobacter sp. 1P04PC]|uniref:ArsR/SmtB family transcription factor n=1 Tax=unclassified Arthrobacter TaxID=235627 RepID=UPI00399F6ECA
MVTDDVFAVIAESTRREILMALRDGDKAVGELVQELEASQPTISKHLKVLREADLVSMRAQGQKRYYALNPGPLADVASWLGTFDGVAPAEPVATAPAETVAVDAAPAEAPGSLADAVTGTPSDNGQSTRLPAESSLSPAVALPVGTLPDGTLAPGAVAEDRRPQQIGRTVGRAATRAADLLANLPKFGRKK